MEPLDVIDLLTEYNVGPLDVERRGPPVQNPFGGYSEVDASIIRLDPVAVHSVDGQGLLQVPEADRQSEVIKVYTSTRLYVGREGQAPDVLLYAGSRFRIVSVVDLARQGSVFISLGVLE